VRASNRLKRAISSLTQRDWPHEENRSHETARPEQRILDLLPKIARARQFFRSRKIGDSGRCARGHEVLRDSIRLDRPVSQFAHRESAWL